MPLWLQRALFLDDPTEQFPCAEIDDRGRPLLKPSQVNIARLHDGVYERVDKDRPLPLTEAARIARESREAHRAGRLPETILTTPTASWPSPLTQYFWRRLFRIPYNFKEKQVPFEPGSGWGKDGQDAPGPPFVRSKTVATSGGNRLKE